MDNRYYFKNRRDIRLYLTRWYKLYHPCVDCGEDNPLCLTFDHIEGDKEFNISQGRDITFENLLSEIQKCEVVCANCHAIRTASVIPFRPAPHYYPRSNTKHGRYGHICKRWCGSNIGTE